MLSVKLGLLSSIFFYHTSLVTHAAFLRCYNGSLNHYTVAPLTKPDALLKCIRPSLPTVIYTFGYRGKTSGPATTAVLKAYIKKKKKNVILLDWEDEARSGYFGIPLGYALTAVPNAKLIGRELGDALIWFLEAGIDIKNIHLVGHSLGAHIMGFAGRRVRQHHELITRITGLDPARALFEGELALQTGIDRTCAMFVDIIHTDPGGYGISSTCGTVDIWPNYGNDDGVQPGCPIGQFNMFTPEDLCSHDRSWRYFVDALEEPTSFPCEAAENYDDWVSNRGQIKQQIFLGELTDIRAKGNYFLNTYERSPHGMGNDPSDMEIRKKRKTFNAKQISKKP